MTTLYASLYQSQWPQMLAAFGVSATLTDSGGVGYSVTGILTPRSQESALDVTWEETAKQVEFVCLKPTGFVLAPRECTLTVDTVEYTILSEGLSDGATVRYMCERKEIDAVGLRHRRY